jgi:thiol-disulfide isomerase/thioredoxin
MKDNKAFLPWTIRIVISILFLVSALAKLYPSPYFAISTFEVKQLYTMGFSESIAPFFSRILIGIEIALGLLMLQNNWLKKFIIPATIALLAVFVVHLSYVTFLSGGNSGNCGCFGELIPMTPIEAIIKNIVAIGLLFYLLYLLKNMDLQSKNNFWILTTVTLASVLSLFMLAPIQPKSDFVLAPVSESIEDTLVPTIETAKLPIVDSTAVKITKDTIKKVTTEVVVAEPKKVKSGFANFFPKIDSGKKILALFVPGCDHCRDAAKELNEMKQKDKNFPPVSVIFMNEEADLIPEFFKAAGTEYPHTIIEIIPFWKALGTGKDTPGVKYLWNGNDIKYYTGIADDKFDGSDLRKNLDKSYDELKKANPKL